MAFAKGRAFVILNRMAETNPEAKKLLNNLNSISQEDFDGQFGKLLGNGGASKEGDTAPKEAKGSKAPEGKEQAPKGSKEPKEGKVVANKDFDPNKEGVQSIFGTEEENAKSKDKKVFDTPEQVMGKEPKGKQYKGLEGEKALKQANEDFAGYGKELDEKTWEEGSPGFEKATKGRNAALDYIESNNQKGTANNPMTSAKEGIKPLAPEQDTNAFGTSKAVGGGIGGGQKDLLGKKGDLADPNREDLRKEMETEIEDYLTQTGQDEDAIGEAIQELKQKYMGDTQKYAALDRLDIERTGYESTPESGAKAVEQLRAETAQRAKGSANNPMTSPLEGIKPVESGSLAKKSFDATPGLYDKFLETSKNELSDELVNYLQDLPKEFESYGNKRNKTFDEFFNEEINNLIGSGAYTEDGKKIKELFNNLSVEGAKPVESGNEFKPIKDTGVGFYKDFVANLGEALNTPGETDNEQSLQQKNAIYKEASALINKYNFDSPIDGENPDTDLDYLTSIYLPYIALAYANYKRSPEGREGVAAPNKVNSLEDFVKTRNATDVNKFLQMGKNKSLKRDDVSYVKRTIESMRNAMKTKK